MWTTAVVRHTVKDRQLANMAGDDLSWREGLRLRGLAQRACLERGKLAEGCGHSCACARASWPTALLMNGLHWQWTSCLRLSIDLQCCRFVAGLQHVYEDFRKPFNPILGETWQAILPQDGTQLFVEQISHHPPVSAFQMQGPGEMVESLSDIAAAIITSS